MFYTPLFFLLACIEYKFSPEKQINASPTDDSASVNGNSAVETSSPCAEFDLSPVGVAVDESCYEVPSEGEWDPVIEWRSLEPGNAYSTPVVGQLTDDNGDGLIDDNDTPDVVISSAVGKLTVFSGDGSLIHWSVNEINDEQSTPAIADLDGDGKPEVVVAGSHFMRAYHGSTGDVYWENLQLGARCGGPGVYDLNGDGKPEIVLGSWIIDGQTGTLLYTGEHGFGSGHNTGVGAMGVAADIDVDGTLEVVVGNALYSPTGETIWYNGEADGFVAIGNFDEDPFGEIVVTHFPGMVRLQDDDGSVIWSDNYMGQTVGPPTVADFDNDGQPEIGVAGQEEYKVLKADGSVLWSKPINELTSGFTSASVFDFEGDGEAEVVYADEQNVWVFDGATGHVKLKMEEHSSATCSEYPAIADVDGDGQAEIVYTSSVEYWYATGDDEGVRVIGDRNGSWQPARTIWNQYSYDITNVENSAGKIPTEPTPNWLLYNNFRAANLSAATGGVFADAVPIAGDVCTDECEDGVIRVVFQMGNAGTTGLPAGVPVSLYAKQGQSWVVVTTDESIEAIPSGESGAGFHFQLQPEAVPEGELLFVVDDMNGLQRIHECNEENNELQLSGVLCSVD